MEVGDEKQVTVAPGEGYGERDESRIQVVTRDAFPAQYGT
jgi:FKBP-type peptidyl-prolyl cis-trans isomerase 2